MLRTSAASRRRTSQYHASSSSSSASTATPSGRSAGSRSNDTPTAKSSLRSARHSLSTPLTTRASQSSTLSKSVDQQPRPSRALSTRRRGSDLTGPLSSPSRSAPSLDSQEPSRSVTTRTTRLSLAQARPPFADNATENSTTSASYASSFASSNPAPSQGTPSTSDQEHSSSSLSDLSDVSDLSSLSDNEEDVVRRVTRRSAKRNSSAASPSEAQGKGKARAESESEADSNPALTTPSRRSARISISGSGLHQASARRDELDERLLGKTPSPALARIQRDGLLAQHKNQVQQPLAPQHVESKRGASQQTPQQQPTEQASQHAPPPSSQQKSTQQEPQQVPQPDAVPVKRGRGRPRKIRPETTSISAQGTVTPGTGSVSQPGTASKPSLIGSRRGRPRISRDPVHSQSDNQRQQPAPINARASPATVQPMLAQPQGESTGISSTDTPLKRKRGRPPGSGKKQIAAARAAAAAAAARAAADAAAGAAAAVAAAAVDAAAAVAAVDAATASSAAAYITAGENFETGAGAAYAPASAAIAASPSMHATPSMPNTPPTPATPATPASPTPPQAAIADAADEIADQLASPGSSDRRLSTAESSLSPSPLSEPDPTTSVESARAEGSVAISPAAPSPDSSVSMDEAADLTPANAADLTPADAVEASPLADAAPLETISAHEQSAPAVLVSAEGSSSEESRSLSRTETSPSLVLPPKRLKATSRSWNAHISGLYYNSASEAGPATASGQPDADEGRGRGASSAFPEPMHFGFKLLTEDRAFRLPSKWVEDASKIKARLDAKKKPPPYTQIKTNKYFSRPKLQGELPQCQCHPSSNCGDSCMNRILQYVCSPKNCPCGERCTNISLGKRPNVKTEVFYCGPRGFGLRSLEDVPKGGFIDEYRGEVIDQAETNRRTEEYKQSGNYYFLSYDNDAGEYLDGGRKGNITRFANHSCDPNCYIEKWLLCGTDESRTADFQIGLFALKDIKAGDELTYNYGWSYFRPRTLTGDYIGEPVLEPCYCGASNCAGVLGGKKVPAKNVEAAAQKASGAAGKKKRGPGRPKTIATKLARQVRASTPAAVGQSGRGSRKKQEKAIVAKRATKVIARRAEMKRRTEMALHSNRPVPGDTPDETIDLSSDSSSVIADSLDDDPQSAAEGEGSSSFLSIEEAHAKWDEQFKIRSARLLQVQEQQRAAQLVLDEEKEAMAKVEREYLELRDLSMEQFGEQGERINRTAPTEDGPVTMANPRHVQFALAEAGRKLEALERDCAIAEQKLLLADKREQRARDRLDHSQMKRDIRAPPSWSPVRGRSRALTSASPEDPPSQPGRSGAIPSGIVLSEDAPRIAASPSSSVRQNAQTDGASNLAGPSGSSGSDSARLPFTVGPSPSRLSFFTGMSLNATKRPYPSMPASRISQRDADFDDDFDDEEEFDQLPQTPGAFSAMSESPSKRSSAGGVKRRRHGSNGTSNGGTPRSKRPPEDITPEEIAEREAHRRERNAFLARKRRAMKRGIIIEDPTEHPLRKQSIQCESAPENAYIPDLPSSLIRQGMTKEEARRVRNAFLARVRRAKKRGNDESAAITLSAKPLPSDASLDTPVIRAHRVRRSLGQSSGGEGEASPSLSAFGGDSSYDSGSFTPLFLLGGNARDAVVDEAPSVLRLPLALPLEGETVGEARREAETGSSRLDPPRANI